MDEMRTNVDRLIADPRTQFALDLLDPRLFGTILQVPPEFQVLAHQAANERNFWGCVDGHLCVALGVHHGVDTKSLAAAVLFLAERPNTKSDCFSELMIMLHADADETDRLGLVLRNCTISLADSRAPTSPVPTICSNALKTVAATMPVHSYLFAADTKIYNMALLHLRSTLQQLDRIVRHTSTMKQYVEEAMLGDSRWEQVVLWVRATPRLMANPLPLFFGSSMCAFVRSIFKSEQVSAGCVPFFNRQIWQEDRSYGQMAVVSTDEFKEKQILQEGTFSGMFFPWANQSYSKLRAGYAARNVVPLNNEDKLFY